MRHSPYVLAASLSAVAVAIYLSTNVPLVTDFAQLLPENARSVTEHRRSKNLLGNTSLLTVLVEAKGNDALIRSRTAAERLANRLRADPEFTRVVFRLDKKFFEDNGLLYLDVTQLRDLKQRLDERISAEVLKSNPLYVDLDDEEPSVDQDEADNARDTQRDEIDVFDPKALQEHYLSQRSSSIPLREYFTDGKTAHLIVLQPRLSAVDMHYNSFILGHLDEHIAAARSEGVLASDITTTISGNHLSAAEENTSVKTDLRTAGLISFGLLLAVIVFYFRRLRATWTIFVPLLSGVALMMGYVKLSVGRLNTITGFCFALFMGLSIDFAIHLLSRYDEERSTGASVFDSLLCTYRETGRAALAAAATSAAGFLAITIADFKGFREFGIIAAGGIVICLGTIAILMPAMIALSLRFVRETQFATFSPKSKLGHRTRQLVVIAVAAMTAAACTSAVMGISWEDDLRNLRGGREQTLRDSERVKEILGRSTQPAVRLTKSLEDARLLAAACNREREQRSPSSTVFACGSLADFVPRNQEEKLKTIAEIAALLPDNRLAALEDDVREHLQSLRDNAPTRVITRQDLPEQIRASFTNFDGSMFLMKAYPSVQNWLISSNVRFFAELKAVDQTVEDDIGPIGTAMIMSDVVEVMKKDGLIVLVASLCAIYLVLFGLFRSLTRALACFAPLGIGILCTLGMMTFLNMKLGFYNMIIIPSLVGIGVDNNIYLLHRYHVEGRGSWHHVVRTTGWACIMAAVTTMAGFTGLSLASHLGLQSIGNMAIVGISMLTLISIVLVPVVFRFLERRVAGSALGLLPNHPFQDGPPSAKA